MPDRGRQKRGLGYQPVSDAEFVASLPTSVDEMAENWSDPRRGDLFNLIEQVLKKGEQQ